MKKFMSEFKNFIAKGDVMSMAVGIIIGGAFTAIVNSLVSDVITPIIGMITGGIDFTGVSITLGDAHIMIGNFIQAIIVFFLTALVLFFIVKSFNKLTQLQENFESGKEDAAAEEAPAPIPADIQLLTEIRDLLKDRQ